MIGYKLVGNTTPGAPVGKIYASETMIAQIGIKKTLECVREIYKAAWEHEGRKHDTKQSD